MSLGGSQTEECGDSTSCPPHLPHISLARRGSHVHTQANPQQRGGAP